MASRSRSGGSTSIPEEALTWNGMDFSVSGLTIQQSMVFAKRRTPSPKPIAILWAGNVVRTSDVMEVPLRGLVSLRMLSPPTEPLQAADLKLEPQGLLLADGSRVGLLRTWNDEKYEPAVRYTYATAAPQLRVWNSYQMRYREQVVEEHWTENAGMIVERIGALHRRYRCSPGWASPPDFNSFIFEVFVESSPGVATETPNAT